MKTLAIVTPTYNRETLLIDLYESLEKQTIKDFTWYVVDDGSSDNTEELISKLKKQASFDIVYEKKKNGGKHTALNRAYELINEELTIIADSDDMLTENAVETIIKDYDDIKNNDMICALSYLVLDKQGNVVGKKYTEDGIVESFIEQRINKNIYGDKREVFKTKILKQYKFPEFEGERFLSESTVWCKMALDYKMKFYNKAIYICEYLAGGLSDNVHRTLFKNPKGSVECYLYMSTKQVSFKQRLKYTIAYIVYSFAAKIKCKEQFKRVNSKLIYMATFIPAFFIYLRKKRKYRN